MRRTIDDRLCAWSLVIAESEDRHEVPITRCGHAGNTIHVVVMRLACAIRFV